MSASTSCPKATKATKNFTKASPSITFQSYWREHPCYLQYHPGSEFFLILTTLANLFAKLRIIYEIVIDNA